VTTMISKRTFLGAGAGALIGLGYGSIGAPIASGQSAGAANASRRARTTPLYKAPDGFPNALAGSREGLWIGEQKLSAGLARRYGMEEPQDLAERAWLVDWKTGEVLKTVTTESRNTSGMGYGDGYVWMVANAPPHGVFQTDTNSRTVSHRQVPLGGGGTHGAKFRDGKLWIVSTRLRGILRIDASSWQPEFLIPYDCRKRHHDMAFDDDGKIWLVTGNQNSTAFAEGEFGLAKYDPSTGQLLETVAFEPGSADPHGLEYHDGVLYSCDAGIHPGWPVNDSPFSGQVFRIDFL
jgi:hypothetical protein